MLKIAHRGASSLAPENTIAAFKKAVELNFDMIELDLQLSKDGRLVVFHDKNLKRIAGINKKVKDLTVSQLKRIDIGSWFDKEFAGERIPILQEVIKLVKGEVKLNIELKPERTAYNQLLNKLINLLYEEDYQEEVIISSFDHLLIKQVKELESAVTTAVLTASASIKPAKIIEWANADGIHPNYQVVTRDWIARIKESNYFINVWTVNQRSEVKRLKEIGVDGIITNTPGVFID